MLESNSQKSFGFVRYRANRPARWWLEELDMKRILRIKAVAVTGPLKLIVRFDNGIEKAYDCAPLLARPQFRPLGDSGLFHSVKVDAGGYGISWSDAIDLSEYELWTNGKPSAGKNMPTATPV